MPLSVLVPANAHVLLTKILKKQNDIITTAKVNISVF